MDGGWARLEKRKCRESIAQSRREDEFQNEGRSRKNGEAVLYKKMLRRHGDYIFQETKEKK